MTIKQEINAVTEEAKVQQKHPSSSAVSKWEKDGKASSPIHTCTHKRIYIYARLSPEEIPLSHLLRWKSPHIRKI